MLQTDSSPHDWLEGRGPPLTLVGAIDDATSKVPLAFFEQAETSWAYFHLFDEIFKKEGLPHSLYSDCHSIFWTDREPTLEEQLRGKRPTTEVGRALEELGITLIPAGSPQAKGGIERLWGTFQDRLVSELRLAGAKTQAEAQASWRTTCRSLIGPFQKPLERLSPPGERSTLTSSNSLCVLSTNARWPMITPSTSKERCFRFQRKFRRALTPVNGLTSMSC